MQIDILMATYNGGQFVENQILSVIAQTHKDWRLFIHDDGSTDNTLDIIRDYQKKNTQIILIEDDYKGLGAARNFLHLFSFASNELIAFCDQDDIWFENKLKFMHDLYLEIPNKNEPIAIFCNGYGYDAQIGIIGQSIVEVEPKSLNSQLFLNTGIHGCCLMFNDVLKMKVTPVPSFVAMHDHLITLCAITFGQLYYLKKPLMLYRQNHFNKATTNIEFNRFRRILSIFNRKIGVVERTHFCGTKSFYETYKNLMISEQIKLFEAYFLFCDSRFMGKRIFILLKHRFEIYGGVYKLVIKTILRKRMI